MSSALDTLLDLDCSGFFATTEDGMNCNAEVNTPAVSGGVGNPISASFIVCMESTSVNTGDVIAVVVD